MHIYLALRWELPVWEMEDLSEQAKFEDLWTILSSCFCEGVGCRYRLVSSRLVLSLYLHTGTGAYCVQHHQSGEGRELVQARFPETRRMSGTSIRMGHHGISFCLCLEMESDVQRTSSDL